MWGARGSRIGRDLGGLGCVELGSEGREVVRNLRGGGGCGR